MFTMRKTAIAARVALMLAAAGGMGSAMATDGYFPHGYGMKALGMGGASVAMTDNAFAGANNPATAVGAGNRMDVGVNVFSPKRAATTMGMSGMMETQSDSNYFLVPEFGYIKQADAKTAYGVTVYGNGGMNTNYPLPIMGGAGKTGVNLMQLIVAPTAAYKVSPDHAFGVSPLLVYQQFKAEGLQAFQGFMGGMLSVDPSSLTNNGNASSRGVGVRVGYMGKLSDQVSVGASYSPKISMSKFDKYAGLFSEGGKFDIPANMALGLAMQVNPAVKVALDYQRIEYSGVPSIGNPSANLFNVFAGDMTSRLGGANGPGFGWSDVNVVKIGAEWNYSSSVTLRAGFNHSTNPIRPADVSFNILAPGVITKHYTLGATYKVAKDAELTWAYMYAPESKVTGPSLFPAFNGGNPGDWQDSVKMSQQSLGVQYSWKF